MDGNFPAIDIGLPVGIPIVDKADIGGLPNDEVEREQVAVVVEQVEIETLGRFGPFGIGRKSSMVGWSMRSETKRSLGLAMPINSLK